MPSTCSRGRAPSPSVDSPPMRARSEARAASSSAGGEVTLAKDLLEYVAIARALPGIEHVRIQTNAIRLGDRAYLRALIDAGVDEYFVSFHAHDAALYEAIAQRKGAFAGIVRGLSAIRDSGATLITNTAVVEANYRVLPAIVEAAAAFGPRSIELWSYWPRGDGDGARQHTARVADVRGPLLEALEVAVSRGIPPVVKWFPRCLLGAMAWCQDDGQPPALIEDGYWEQEPEYGCLYEGVCAESMGRPPERSGGARQVRGAQRRLREPLRVGGEPAPAGAAPRGAGPGDAGDAGAARDPEPQGRALAPPRRRPATDRSGAGRRLALHAGPRRRAVDRGLPARGALRSAGGRGDGDPLQGRRGHPRGRGSRPPIRDARAWRGRGASISSTAPSPSRWRGAPRRWCGRSPSTWRRGTAAGSRPPEARLARGRERV